MSSRARQVDEKDFLFLLKRTGFLLLGALAGALTTVWVPFFEGSEQIWGPILAMTTAGFAEAINRFIQNYKDNPEVEERIVYRDKLVSNEPCEY